jgi:hypothetical protein
MREHEYASGRLNFLQKQVEPTSLKTTRAQWKADRSSSTIRQGAWPQQERLHEAL